MEYSRAEDFTVASVGTNSAIQPVSIYIKTKQNLRIQLKIRENFTMNANLLFYRSILCGSYFVTENHSFRGVWSFQEK